MTQRTGTGWPLTRVLSTSAPLSCRDKCSSTQAGPSDTYT